jgi:DNA (cytosine-5)-methyltransferase 1
MTINFKNELHSILLKFIDEEQDCFPDLRQYKSSLTQEAQKALNLWKFQENRHDSKNAFQIIDLFCGCGGMSLGFAALSRFLPAFRLIGGCDINADALTTYTKNLGAPGIKADVRNLAKDDKALKNFLGATDGYDAKKPLVLIGCAPCQGFTSHRKKNWSNEDARNTLIGAFAVIATKLKPACIVMENVPEMLSMKYWEYFAGAKNILEKAGYIVHSSIYNAATFGVPQERFRSVVLAMQKEFLLPDPVTNDPISFQTVRNAIGSLPAVKPGDLFVDDKYHRCAAHRTSTIATIKAVPHNGGNRPPGIGPKCLDRVKGFSDVYGRLYWDKPAITITHYARNPASGRFVHPEQNRGLTTREASLLQSFPYGFEFTGTYDSMFKQIGEAVPPKLACGIAANVLIELLSTLPKKKEKLSSVLPITEPVSNSYSSVIAGIKSKKNR